jgi:hypothetical protein
VTIYYTAVGGLEVKHKIISSSLSHRSQLSLTRIRTSLSFPVLDKPNLRQTGLQNQGPTTMILTRILAVGLLPGIIFAWPAHVHRGVDCQYTTAPDSGATCESFASSREISIEDLKSLNSSIS